MRVRRGERGEGKLGCLFGLILLGLAILVAWKMIPVKVRAAELRQVVVDEAKAAGTHNNQQIMGAIMAKVYDTRLPVAEDDVKINRKDGQITVDVEYDVPIDFPGYTYKWHQHHHAENPIF
jgi:inner membrane protein involved in colicin E2 resistance